MTWGKTPHVNSREEIIMKMYKDGTEVEVSKEQIPVMKAAGWKNDFEMEKSKREKRVVVPELKHESKPEPKHESKPEPKHESKPESKTRNRL